MKKAFWINGPSTAGRAKGGQGKAEVVANLISEFGFTDEQVMNAADVSLDFVKKSPRVFKKI